MVLVLAIHQRLKSYAPRFSKLTSAFGIIWVGLVIASGMIANIGPNSVIGIRATENAMLVWSSVSLISEGLGGGNKIIGNSWNLRCFNNLPIRNFRNASNNLVPIDWYL